MNNVDICVFHTCYQYIYITHTLCVVSELLDCFWLFYIYCYHRQKLYWVIMIFTHRPPSTVHRLLFNVHCSPPSTVHRPPSTVHRPLSTVHRLLSIVHCPSSTVHRPLSTVHRPLFTVHCSPSTVHRPLFTVHCSPSTVHRPLFTVHCSPSTVHRPLFTVQCTPSTVHRLLSTVHRPLVYITVSVFPDCPITIMCCLTYPRWTIE